MKPPAATIVIPAFNAAATVGDCVRSVLDNSFFDFELILVDDCSTDSTPDISRSFQDPRIKLIRNLSHIGQSSSTNKGISLASGGVVFFLNSDCLPDKDWLKQGLAAFGQSDALGVEGSIFHHFENPCIRNYIPVNPFYNLSHHRPVNPPHQDFASGNIAYRTAVLRQVGGFDTETFFAGREDTDLAFRVLKKGKIVFNPNMKVVHLDTVWTWPRLKQNAKRYQADVVFVKRHGKFFFKTGPILHPEFMKMLVFPPLIWLRFRPWIKSAKDLQFLCLFYLYLALLRLNIWKAALRNRVRTF